MCNNIEDLKAFILWCRDNKIKKVMLETGVLVEFSDLAFIEDLQQPEKVKEMNLGVGGTLLDSLKPNPKEDDEDLYWSAK